MAGELDVHVRVLVEGEEETPADTAERWMHATSRSGRKLPLSSEAPRA